jgi:hypothetical protein
MILPMGVVAQPASYVSMSVVERNLDRAIAVLAAFPVCGGRRIKHVMLQKPDTPVVVTPPLKRNIVMILFSERLSHTSAWRRWMPHDVHLMLASNKPVLVAVWAF